MPRGDGTGPQGMGLMTGRAAGFCAGYNTPGYAKPLPGRGRGFGRGRGSRGCGFGGSGRGWRHWFYTTGLPGWLRFSGYATPVETPTPNPKSAPEIEKQALQTQANALQSQLEMIQKRLSKIDVESPAK